MSQYVLGIDGGGSKTLAFLATSDGRVLARGTAGASNYHAIGAERAFAALEAAIAGIASDNVPDAICLGLAGAARPRDVLLFRDWAETRWPGKPITIVNDADLVLAAGTPAGWGLGMICGTGSIVYGSDSAGRAARAGGWGYLLGDEGSGHAIGLAALRAVTRAADGRDAPTALTDAILAHWSLATPHELIRRVYTERAAPAEIAALAALVDDAATGGDAVASQIIGEAAHELVLALRTVARQLALTGAIPCALAGGVIAHRDRFRERVLAVAEHAGLILDPVSVVLEPAMGAVRIAVDLLGAERITRSDT